MAKTSGSVIFLVVTLLIAVHVSISDAREMKMQETKYESDPEINSAFKADINQFGRCTTDSDCEKKCFPSCQLRKCSIRHTCECSLC
ncbi:hypothetical protein N665_0293s0027 [Sinapis alba]|nr:hypothetical protein N665_0293s0027 [Sinapis alba]